MKYSLSRYIVFALVMQIAVCNTASNAHSDAPHKQGELLVASAAQVGQGTQNAARAAAQTATPTSGVDLAPTTQLQTPGVGVGVAPAGQMQTHGEAPIPVLRAPINPSAASQVATPIDSQVSNSGKTIDSFFQTSKTAPSARAVSVSNEKSRKKAKCGSKSFLWHFMDNAGIPMFFGDTGPELDPRLKRDYRDPQLPDLNVKNGMNRVDSTRDGVSATAAQRGASCDPQMILHKIPEGQLDGTQVSPQNVKIEP